MAARYVAFSPDVAIPRLCRDMVPAIALPGCKDLAREGLGLGRLWRRARGDDEAREHNEKNSEDASHTGPLPRSRGTGRRFKLVIAQSSSRRNPRRCALGARALVDGDAIESSKLFAPRCPAPAPALTGPAPPRQDSAP
jgi:hypothetical protein